MKLPNYFRSVFLVAALLVGIVLPLFSLLAEEIPDPLEGKGPATKKQETNVIQIYSWATILPQNLIDLQSRMAEERSIKAIGKELSVLKKEAELLQADMTDEKMTSELQFMNTRGYKTKLYKLTSRLERLSRPITSTISYLSDQRTEWQLKKDQILGFDKKELLSITLADRQQKRLVETIDNALEFIDEQLELVLGIGKKIADFQVLLYSVDADLDSMAASLRSKAIKKTSSSVLSRKFYAKINLNQFKQSYLSTKRFIESQLDSLRENRNLALFTLFAFLLVYVWVYKTRSNITAASRWFPFAVFPLATTIFLASSLNFFLDMLPIEFDLPVQWEALLFVSEMLATTCLIKHLIEDKLQRQLLRRLVLFMAVAMSMVVIDLPKVFILLYVFYASILALVYYFYQLPSLKGKTDFTAWLRRIVGILPASILLFGISGYDQLAVVLFSALLAAAVAVLVVWILYLLHFGVLDYILSRLPVSMIQENREIILKSLRPTIVCIHIVLLLAIQATIWDIYPNAHVAFVEIFINGFNIFNIHVSPGFFLIIFFVIYGAMLVSKAIQMLLLNKILPRYGAERGVQLSITRLTHYAVLTAGFLLMLNVLGFQLNQLALLGGALGVGIGFGLQAIVNNFTSGLILLFERPIKVGDTIQIGPELGEVKNLGLRATVIQTFDNAEIVVPNSDLITLQVTNWTLAERKVRVRIPVGVAYGSDVASVLKILLACGEANPMVLSTPPATAFFLAFGASSLDFELRVWVPDFLDKLQVLSDLNQDIENEFAINDIEIPFPQTDLHLRSVDEGAASSMWGSSGPGKSNELTKKLKTRDGESDVPEITTQATGKDS